MEENALIKTQSNLIKPIDTKEVIEKFLSTLDVRPVTKKAYQVWLKHYINWLTANKKLINQATNADLINYKQYLLTECKPLSTQNATDKDKVSIASISSFLIAVKRLYTWFHAIGFYPVNIAADLKPPKSVKKLFKKQGLTKEEIIRLLIWSEENQNVKQLAIVATLLYTGIREIELVRANIGDIVIMGGKRCLKVQGKGRDEKDEFVIIVDDLWEAIKSYLITRKIPQPNEPLFASDSKRNWKGRLATRTVQYIAREGLDALGLYKENGYTCHSLRHSFAQSLLRAGGTIEDAQGVLRHSSANTTLAYTNAIKQERRIENAPEERVAEFLRKS